MTILSAKNISFSFLNKNIVNDLSLTITSGEKITLLGRNGMGKSTLIKLLKHELEPDSGQVEHKNDLKIAQLSQSCSFKVQDSCQAVLLANNRYLSKEQAANLIKSDNLEQKLFSELSGGQQRRILLRSVIITEPDLLILDEPTNHIDIISIRAIIKQLKRFHGACLIISHDRWFINQLPGKIWDLHNGKIKSYQCDFDSYQKSKQASLEHERSLQSERRSKLKREEHWLQRGVTARRKRNVGRLQKLQQLRQEISDWRDPERRAKLMLTEEKASAQKVITIKNLNLSVAQKTLLKNFSYDIFRGEKIGLVGGNGAGKTTLINNIITNNSAVKLGARLEIAYFRQQHVTVPENETALSYIAKNGEYINQGDRKIHIASYLKGFNFDENQFKTPVNKLSGGERHRLMLANCLAKPANLLILDEPTNDLDLETLEILEQLLVDFKGTLLIISHDQKFLDNVITTCWILKDQEIQVTNGNISSWAELLETKTVKDKKLKPKADTKKLSYNDQRRLANIPLEIEQLEQEIATRNNAVLAENFYQQDQTEIKNFHQQTQQLNKQLDQLYTLWEQLEQDV